jgi:hypothetical protein
MCYENSQKTELEKILFLPSNINHNEMQIFISSLFLFKRAARENRENANLLNKLLFMFSLFPSFILFIHLDIETWLLCNYCYFSPSPYNIPVHNKTSFIFIIICRFFVCLHRECKNIFTFSPSLVDIKKHKHKNLVCAFMCHWIVCWSKENKKLSLLVSLKI